MFFISKIANSVKLAESLMSVLSQTVLKTSLIEFKRRREILDKFITSGDLGFYSREEIIEMAMSLGEVSAHSNLLQLAKETVSVK
jgi:hypothetical protein